MWPYAENEVEDPLGLVRTLMYSVDDFRWGWMLQESVRQRMNAILGVKVRHLADLTTASLTRTKQNPEPSAADHPGWAAAADQNGTGQSSVRASIWYVSGMIRV
jgi:hypothetical protein